MPLGTTTRRIESTQLASQISRTAHNLLALFHDRAFKVEEGEFGPRLHVRSAWTAAHAEYMHTHGIKEIRITDGPSLADSVTDIGFLAELPMLEGLASLTHRIKDLSPLKLLPRLRALTLGHAVPSGPKTVDPRWFPHLERLYLGARFPQPQQIFECAQLLRLGLTQFPAKNESSSPLAQLSKLQQLKLASSGLQELDALLSIAGLEAVDFALMKHLQSLEGLRTSAPRLKVAKFESCPSIKSIEPLAKATHLSTLALYDCGQIESLTALKNMPALTELYFGGNTDIVDGKLQFLKQLPSLSVLRGVHRPHYDIDVAEFKRLCKH